MENDRGKFVEFVIIGPYDPLWETVARFAGECSWRAGKALCAEMSENAFSDWERVIVALEGTDIAGYCTVKKSDCIPNVPYTPYIGYVFVDEKHRGHRLSQKLILHAMDYLKALGFSRVYLVSDHENLYEKYGFSVIDRQRAPWGEMEKIYIREL